MRDISLHLTDILQNSIAACATELYIAITADPAARMLTIEVGDNGRGMDAKLLDRVTSPFATTRSTRKVGLGIPLFKDASERAGGRLTIQSQPGVGTKLAAVFEIDNIDRPPVGDIAESVSGLLMAYPDMEVKLELKYSDRSFDFDTRIVRQKLGDVAINSFEVIGWIKDYINEGMNTTFGGVLSEIIN